MSERALSGLCGLPVCDVGSAVSPERAFDQRRRFRIDGRANRVYDITERKVRNIKQWLSLLLLSLSLLLLTVSSCCTTAIITFFFQKFCSDLCFRRSVHFARQISSEPLWMRPEKVDQGERFRARLAGSDLEL